MIRGTPVVRRVQLPALALAALAAIACGPDSPSPSSPSEGITTSHHGSGSDGLLFQARLAPVTGGPGQGVLLLEVADGQLTAKVRATGLEPLAVIPQHIHRNPTCNPGGLILLNLDAGLTVAGEGPGVGPAYPRANDGGVVSYDASRSLADLIDAANQHQSAGVTTVEELLNWLDLPNRNMHTHQPVPPFTPVGCGPIEQIR